MKRISLGQIKEKISNSNVKNNMPKANIVLLILTLIVVFIVPAFPYENYIYINYILIMGLFLSAVSLLKKNQNFLIGVSIFLPTAILIGRLIEIEIITSFFRIVQFFFFLFLVGSLITRVSKIASVTLEVIIDSVVGYLLLGFAFTIIVTIVSVWIPDAYNVSFLHGNTKTVLQDNIYYTFVTFTTTGYGDILPTHPVSKSLSVLIGVSGQLYLAVIIAMLVGKYASVGRQSL